MIFMKGLIFSSYYNDNFCLQLCFTTLLVSLTKRLSSWKFYTVSRRISIDVKMDLRLAENEIIKILKKIEYGESGGSLLSRGLVQCR